MGKPQPATDPVTDGTGPAARRRHVVQAGHDGDRAGAATFLADPDPLVRAAALGALARAGGMSIAVLRDALADRDELVRRRGCEEAGRWLAAGTPGGDEVAGPDETATPAVLSLLDDALGDPADAVVEAASWASGEAGPAAAASVDALCRVAAGHRGALCRESAVAALGAIGDARGLDTVLGALDDRPAVRRRAAVALAAFDDQRAEAGLRRCLEDRDWQVRQAAEELLRDA